MGALHADLGRHQPVPGTIGLFSTLFLLFLKFVPAVAVTEVKELRHELAQTDAHDRGREAH